MGMPITVEVVDNFANEKEIDKIFRNTTIVQLI